MRIVVVGTGYVGLVTGACFAEMGNHVACVDVDAAKVAQLQAGESTIYEPGLDDLLASNCAAGRLTFGTDLSKAIADAELVFIAVGTPQGEDGAADLSHVLGAARDIGRCLNHPVVVVIKSTVPPGTGDRVRAEIDAALKARGTAVAYEIASNPEFLKEGSAIKDFMSPDRIIVGTDSERAQKLMRDLYRTFMRTHDRLMFMGVRDAELTKYAANAMLATKISFINEMACIAERVGADVEQVRLGIGADERIGHHFIYPGCGFGGSCFPKDVRALARMAQEHAFEPLLLNAVQARNARQKEVLFTKLSDSFGGDLKGRRIAVWGLAFKPGTDDVREASSLVLIRALLAAGAQVAAHDPVAMDSARIALGLGSTPDDRISFVGNEYDAVAGADALVLVTEWKQYRQPDFQRIRTLLRTPLILDGRNQYEPERMAELGFRYMAIGRGDCGR